jgi:signal transduction histidine kinase
VAVAREDLEEILGNILENACKWTRSSCEVTARIEDGRTVVVVDDDGPGIPPDVRDRLPARGVRADESAPGSGLGLSIAQDLAQAYGGSLALDDSPANGLRVRMTFPASRDTSNEQE